MTVVARFSSSSDEELTYEVYDAAGELSCNCRGFAFRKACLHVAAVERWRAWQVTIPDRVLPPPVRWQEEVSDGQ